MYSSGLWASSESLWSHWCNLVVQRKEGPRRAQASQLTTATLVEGRVVYKQFKDWQKLLSFAVKLCNRFSLSVTSRCWRHNHRMGIFRMKKESTLSRFYAGENCLWRQTQRRWRITFKKAWSGPDPVAVSLCTWKKTNLQAQKTHISREQRKEIILFYLFIWCLSRLKFKKFQPGFWRDNSNGGGQSSPLLTFAIH